MLRLRKLNTRDAGGGAERVEEATNRSLHDPFTKYTVHFTLYRVTKRVTDGDVA